MGHGLDWLCSDFYLCQTHTGVFGDFGLFYPASCACGGDVAYLDCQSLLKDD